MKTWLKIAGLGILAFFLTKIIKKAIGKSEKDKTKNFLKKEAYNEELI